MKKSALLFLFVAFFTTITQAQISWITKQLDKNISVKFPGTPKETTKNNVETYLYKDNDSTTYIVGILDYKIIANLDSASLEPIKDQQQFADGIRQGMVSQKTNYTFGDITIGKWETYTTYSISGFENTQKKKISMRMILIGSKMYSLSCVVPAGLPDKNKDTFLNSAALLTRKE